MENFLKDLRYALRSLLKNPSFSFLVIILLALGIGVSTTIFTFINAFLLKPFDVKNIEELVAIYGQEEKSPIPFTSISYPNFLDYQAQNNCFSGLASSMKVYINVSPDNKNSQMAFGYLVSGNYFDVLGVKASLGRTFLAEEDETFGSNPVVVLSYSFWQDRFGENAKILGHTIYINKQPFTVIGVAPKGFKGTSIFDGASFWVPAKMYEQILFAKLRSWFNDRKMPTVTLIGRLKSSVSIEQAKDSLKITSNRLSNDYPKENKNRSVILMPLVESHIDPNFRGGFVLASWSLTILAGFVLLIACANVANLFMVRATNRRQEMAIRLALGASQGQIVRQLITESLVLSFSGGILALLTAFLTKNLFWHLKPANISSLSINFAREHMLSLDLDWKVFIFTLVLSLITGMVFALLPALQTNWL